MSRILGPDDTLQQFKGEKMQFIGEVQSVYTSQWDEKPQERILQCYFPDMSTSYISIQDDEKKFKKGDTIIITIS